MGEVVQFSDYQHVRVDQSVEMRDSLVPVEFAVGFDDRHQCLSKIAEYGIDSVNIRRVKDGSDSLLYLMGVRDAICLNKKILETEEISEDEIAQRIDLIQMMENANLALMDNLWASFTRQSNTHNC